MADIKIDDYKKFFDETPVALIRTDLDSGEFLMANKFAAKMFGFSNVEELIENARSTDFYEAKDRKALLEAIRTKGLVEDYELKLRLPSKTIWVSARLRINCGGTCVEGSMIDITPYVELRNAYLAKQKDMGKKLDKKLKALAV